MSADRLATRLATRLSFIVAGFTIAAWAPLVPFAKQRLHVNEAAFGLLLLCIGVGSVTDMLVTGPLNSRFGSKPTILVSGFVLALVLPVLAVAATPSMLGLALLVLGAGLGSLDVAMNVHAIQVERDADIPLMSGFHALYSIGGFGGAALMTALLSHGASPLSGTLGCASLAAAAMGLAWPRLLNDVPRVDGSLFAFPRGIVLLLALLAAVTFLVEGAMLDWGALIATTNHLVAADAGGLAYMLFAGAMTAGRLAGDRIAIILGDRKILLFSGGLAVLGFVVMLAPPLRSVAVSGFLLIGLGATNIVPVFLRRAGKQTALTPSLAISAITTTGYAGILAGPAAIGFVAHATSLSTAFCLVSGFLCLVPLTAGIVAPDGSDIA